MKVICEHENSRFVEKDGKQVMFQCRKCGITWWEDLNDRKDDRYLPRNVPLPRIFDENNPFGMDDNKILKELKDYIGERIDENEKHLDDAEDNDNERKFIYCLGNCMAYEIILEKIDNMREEDDNE